MIILNNYEEFGNVLSNRFHTVLSHLENIDGHFTAFIQVINRSNIEMFKQKTLSYIGLNEQKKSLQNTREILNFNLDKEEDKAWKFLGRTDFREKTIESYSLYDNYKQAILKIEDLPLQSLNSYFSQLTNDAQRAEFTILSKYFNIETSSFITLPIIQFGDFDGMVYVVFDNVDFDLYSSTEVQTRIIKNFSIEYEKLLLEWEKQQLYNPTNKLIDLLSYLQSNEYYQLENTNPILKSLNFRYYYLASNLYYRSTINRLNKYTQHSPTKENNTTQVSTLWEMPENIRTAFHQFLIYFSKYTKDIHQLDIDFTIEKHQSGLKLIATGFDETNISVLDNLLMEYINIFLTQNYSAFKQNSFKSELDKFEYKQKIRELKTENHILKLKIEELLEKQEFIHKMIGMTTNNLKLKIEFFQNPEVNIISFSSIEKNLNIHKEHTIKHIDLQKRIFEETRELVAKNKIKLALDKLHSFFKLIQNRAKENQIILLKAKLDELRECTTNGLNSMGELNLEKAKIINSILSIMKI